MGWKAEYRAWSPIDSKRNYETLNSYQGYGDNLIYGIIKYNENLHIKMGGKNVKTINLETLPSNVVEEYQLENLSIWYFESDTPLDQEEIKLINKNTGQVLDAISLF